MLLLLVVELTEIAKEKTVWSSPYC